MAQKDAVPFQGSLAVLGRTELLQMLP